VMGSGSVIDVPAGIHLSTANELRFANNSVMLASGGTSGFTSAAPQAFGFTGAPVGDITLTEAQIVGQPGANISIVGGNITLQDGAVSGLTTRVETASGHVNIVGVQGTANVPIDPAATGLSVTSYGDVSLIGGDDGLVIGAVTGETARVTIRGDSVV